MRERCGSTILVKHSRAMPYNRSRKMQSTGQAELSVEPAGGETIDAEVTGARPRTWWRGLAEIVVLALILVTLARIIFVRAETAGTSMSPTLNNGDSVLASRATYQLFAPQRGDIVVMRDPLNQGSDVIRRVVGLPGERLEIRGRQVLINGQPLTEDYTGNPMALGNNLTMTIQIQLQPSEYYVLGDNRFSIADSRSWGPVAVSDILGRAWMVYWPPDSTHFLQQQHYTTSADH